MTWAALLIGLLAAALGVVAIEKQRRKGPVTYPLWKGNIAIPWTILFVLFAVIACGVNLPRLVRLVQHNASSEAIIIAQDPQGHCTVTYHYAVSGADYTGEDSQCGVKAGDKRTAYYDTQAPDVSTLYVPQTALCNEILAIAFICLCLPTLIVGWLVMSHVIGRGKPS